MDDKFDYNDDEVLTRRLEYIPFISKFVSKNNPIRSNPKEEQENTITKRYNETIIKNNDETNKKNETNK